MHYQTNICHIRHITSMVIFNICVGWDNCYNRHFRISDPEVVIEQVPLAGNAQSIFVIKGNHMIAGATGVEDALQNNTSGEWVL